MSFLCVPSGERLISCCHDKFNFDENKKMIVQALDDGCDLNYIGLVKRKDGKDTGGGCSALHLAAATGSCEIIQLLIDRHADLHVKDSRYDKTPFEWALDNEMYDAARLLLKYGSIVR